MGTAGNLLTPEGTGALVGAAIAGLATIGFVIRAFVKGWVEAKSQAAQIGSNTTAMMGAVSIGFGRDQQELILQTFMRMAEAQEKQAAALNAIAGSQAKLAETEQRQLNDNIEELLEKLRDAERR